MSDFNPYLQAPHGQQPPQAPPPVGSAPPIPPAYQAAPLGNQSPFDSAPAPVQHHTGNRKKKPAGVLAGLAALLAKFWSVVITFIVKFKFLLLFLKTGGTMLVSMAVYAWAFRSWALAVGFVLLIFVHEMGHVVAAKWKKLPVSAPMFIPFVGALILLKKMPSDALTEAEVGYGGPLFGAVGATACWIAYGATHQPLWGALAYLTAFMNLFNLVPVSPLDGGRIVAAISPYVWLLGLVIMGVWLFFSFNIIILLAIVLGAKRLYQEWHLMGTSAYYRVSPVARLVMGLLYVGLILYLGAMCWSINNAIPQLGIA